MSSGVGKGGTIDDVGGPRNHVVESRPALTLNGGLSGEEADRRVRAWPFYVADLLWVRGTVCVARASEFGRVSGCRLTAERVRWGSACGGLNRATDPDTRVSTPGLGKMSFALAIAAELGRGCRTMPGPFVSEPDGLARQIDEVPAG